jgi:hypothetical protein
VRNSLDCLHTDKKEVGGFHRGVKNNWRHGDGRGGTHFDNADGKTLGH